MWMPNQTGILKCFVERDLPRGHQTNTCDCIRVMSKMSAYANQWHNRKEIFQSRLIRKKIIFKFQLITHTFIEIKLDLKTN